MLNKHDVSKIQLSLTKQVDAKLNVISSCNYDGTGRNIVLHSTDTLRHPFSVTTFEDYVFWTDWDKEAVFRANKFNGKDVEPVTALHMVTNPSISVDDAFNWKYCIN